MCDGTYVQELNPYEVSSTRRNPILADLFARMDLMERRGSGLRKIIESYMREEKYKEEVKPEFRSTETYFKIILKNLNYDNQIDYEKDIKKVNDNQNEYEKDSEKINDNQSDYEKYREKANDNQNEYEKIKSSDRHKKILEMMKSNPNITITELASLLFVSISTVTRDIKQLTNKKMIKYVGSAKSGYWEINDNKKLKPSDRHKKILEMIKSNPNITITELASLLFVSISTVTRDVKQLTNKEMIKYVGSAKSGYWKIKSTHSN